MLLQHSRRDARSADGGWCCCPTRTAPGGTEDEIAEALRAAHALRQRTPHAVPPPGADRRRARHRRHGRSRPTGPGSRGRYRELEELTGSPVVRLNRAVAVAEADGPLAGLALLEGLELPGHRLPAARAELLLQAGRAADAVAAYDVAIARCDNDAEADHLSTPAEHARRLS